MFFDFFVFAFSYVFRAFSVCSFHFATFSCRFSAVLRFWVFSFQFSTHFANFREAVSQISHISSIICLFLSILLLFLMVLKFCVLFPFKWIYDICGSHVAVFRSGFMQIQRFHLILRHFRLASMLLGLGWQTIRQTSQCPPRTSKFDSKITDKHEQQKANRNNIMQEAM